MRSMVTGKVPSSWVCSTRMAPGGHRPPAPALPVCTGKSLSGPDVAVVVRLPDASSQGMLTHEAPNAGWNVALTVSWKLTLRGSKSHAKDAIQRLWAGPAASSKQLGAGK
mmetsp:Transcript_27725/g.73242  ORF Transcript_27725/g.73242 Transcript_27725/m.73242 type:complete len:110 (-) Transcript_27725:53-382(-)